MERKLTNEQVIKVQNYFCNLNNLKYFLGKDEKDCKSNKAGTKANVRTKYGIITINLSTIVDNDISKVIEITSKEIDLKINMYFFSDACNIANAVCTFIWQFDPDCKKPEWIQAIRSAFFLDVDDLKKKNRLFDKIQSKILEIANN